MKKKLKLQDLEIKSFVTSLQDSHTIMGASGDLCPTNPCITPMYPSRDMDCVFTRFDNNCIVAVTGSQHC